MLPPWASLTVGPSESVLLVDREPLPGPEPHRQEPRKHQRPDAERHVGVISKRKDERQGLRFGWVTGERQVERTQVGGDTGAEVSAAAGTARDPLPGACAYSQLQRGHKSSLDSSETPTGVQMVTWVCPESWTPPEKTRN